jgi:hypothetical protein
MTSINVAEALHLTRGLRGEITEPLLSWLVPLMNPQSSSSTTTTGATHTVVRNQFRQCR